MRRPLYIEIISGLLIMLFVYAAVSKLAAFDDFNDTLHQSPFIGKYSHIIRWLLPLTELAISALLLTPGFKLLGMYSSLVLLLVFSIYLTAILFTHSKDLPCTCGGVLQNMSWKEHLVFNGLYIMLCVMGIKSY